MSLGKNHCPHCWKDKKWFCPSHQSYLAGIPNPVEFVEAAKELQRVFWPVFMEAISSPKFIETREMLEEAKKIYTRLSTALGGE